MCKLKNIWNFYYEGFRSMTVGKVLWTLIIIKLFVMFAILRPFFFKPALSVAETEEEKTEIVIDNLTK